MVKKIIPYLLIIITTGMIFWLSNEYLKGSIHSPKTLASEISSPAGELYSYQISEEPPFEYRFLFATTVKFVYNLGSSESSERFFIVYYILSLIMAIAAALSFYILLVDLNFSMSFRMVGILLFITAPPFLLAFTVPVHTREDMLGYTLLIWGLIFVLRRRRWPFLIIAILGCFTRETLLILPFIYLFFSYDKLANRIIFSGIPFCIFIAARLYMGVETYDIWEGIRWNKDNWIQVILFGFITFHFIWIAFFIVLFQQKENTSVFHKSAPWVAFLIISTTFCFGIFNEIRLLFLLFPWVLILSLRLFESKKLLLISTLRENWFKLYALISLVFFAGLTYWLVENINSLTPPSQFTRFYGIWVVCSLSFGYLTFCSLPFFYRIIIDNKKIKALETANGL